VKTNVYPLPPAGTIQVVPSILSADFARLSDEIAVIESVGLHMVHLDIMDGHFVPNITIGPPVVAKIRQHSSLVFDTHLMISEPEKYLEHFVEAGSNHITFHIETINKPTLFIDRIHEMGCSAGITLNPETPVEDIKDVAPLCDMILVMTVHPGFGGQEFIHEMTDKIRWVRNLVGPDIRIEVDGGIDAHTTPIVVNAGADTLVAGHAIFDQKDRKKAIHTIQSAARHSL
jgi:ribulose-phosphate 3-epimerase